MKVVLPSNGLLGTKWVNLREPTFEDLRKTQHATEDEYLFKYEFIKGLCEFDDTKITMDDVQYIYEVSATAVTFNTVTMSVKCRNCDTKITSDFMFGESEMNVRTLDKDARKCSKVIEGVEYNFHILSAADGVAIHTYALDDEDSERMIEENAAKPVMHTVFSAWGGWQWLYQARRCGSEGLITERCAYAPLLGYIWKRMENGDADGTLTQAYALFRLLIDQRNMPGGLRGYSLYYLQRQGVFRTTVSREYMKSEKKEQGTVAVGDNRKWKLSTVKLTDLQKAELDKCYDDMLRFVSRG